MTYDYAKNYGKCQFCGADRVQNPKTQKIFCSAKCWLNPNAPKEPTSPVTPQPAHTPTPAPNQGSQLNFELHQFVTKTMLNEILDKQRKAFREMDGKITEITRQLEYIKGLMETHKEAWAMHKDMLPPLEKPIEPEPVDPELQKALDEITV